MSDDWERGVQSMEDFQRKERREKQENIGIIASSGWSEESLIVWLHFLFGYKVFYYTWFLLSLDFSSPLLEESIFLILLPEMHLSPPLGQSPFLIRMLVPSRPCWRWWNVLLVVKALLRGHSVINTANWVVVVHWMQRWWVLYLETSPLLY